MTSTFTNLTGPCRPVPHVKQLNNDVLFASVSSSYISWVTLLPNLSDISFSLPLSPYKIQATWNFTLTKTHLAPTHLELILSYLPIPPNMSNIDTSAAEKTAKDTQSGITSTGKTVTSTLGNTLGGVTSTAGNVVGTAGRGVGDTVNSATGDMGKPLGDSISSIGSGMEKAGQGLSSGIKDAGEMKKAES